MAKLMGLLLVLGALAAAVALVPVGGRTVLDRWRSARTPTEFATRAYGELAVATGLKDPPPRRAGQAKATAGAKRVPPVEKVSDADRAALERIVADHAEK